MSIQQSFLVWSRPQGPRKILQYSHSSDTLVPRASFQWGISPGLGRAPCWLWSLSPSPVLFGTQGVIGPCPVIAVRCWQLRGYLGRHGAHCFILLIFGYIRGVREFLKFHFLLKIDQWCRLWKLSEYAVSVNAIARHLVLNSEAFFPLPCFILCNSLNLRSHQS